MSPEVVDLAVLACKKLQHTNFRGIFHTFVLFDALCHCMLNMFLSCILNFCILFMVSHYVMLDIAVLNSTNCMLMKFIVFIPSGTRMAVKTS